MRTSILFLSFIALYTGVYAQVDPAPLSAFAKEAQERFDVPSLAIAVVKDGRVVLLEGFGKKGTDAQEAPNEHTMYAIASLSKAFTAASIGMLVDEGKLDWDDKVTDHLPWWKMHDPYVTEHMTIEDLLCHRSGLITFDCDLLWYGTTYTREEAVKRIQHRPPTYEFRSEFGYQNLMFMTAGEVIEEVSGMTWDDFVETRILKPLDMKRTTSSFQTFSTDFNVAKPHLKGEEIFMLSYDNSGATAALNSSTGDMAKWLSFWLNEGIVGDDTLLSSESIDKIWSMHTPLNTGGFDAKHGTHFKGYGQGWFLMDYNGRKVIHHGGGLPGYISKAAVVPEENLGVIVLTNDMNSVPTMLMYATIDWAMGQDFSAWSDEFYDYKQKGEDREARAKEERLATKNPEARTLPLIDYVGTYEDEMYGQAKVTMGADGLIMSFLPAKELFTGKMSTWDDHAFQFEVNDPFLPFGVATFGVEKDVVQGFTVELPNYDFHFDKLDFKKVD